MVSRKDDASGFVWSLFARESFREEPNLYVQRLAEVYGERALFGHGLLPRALEVATRPSDRPELVSVGEERRRAWQENKNERLGHLLDEWAREYVDPLVACLIIGELLAHNGNIEEGIACFRELERLAVDRGDPITESTALGKRAGLLSHSGHLAEAEFLLKRMEALARNLNNGLQLSWALADRGSIAQTRGRIEEAYVFFREAHANARAAGSGPDSVHLLDALAKLERDRGRFEEAMRLYAELESLCRQYGLRIRLVEALRGKADLYAKWGEYEEAQQTLEETREIAVGLGDVHQLAGALLQLGQVLMARSEFEAARTCLREAEHHAAAVGDKRELIYILDARGALAGLEGCREDALQIRERHVKVCRTFDEPRLLGNALHNLGSVYNVVGRRVDGEARLREALSILEEFGDHFSSGLTSRDLARRFAQRNNWPEAYSHFQHSIMHWRTAGHHSEIPQLLAELRPVLAALRDEPEWMLSDVVGGALEASEVVLTDLQELATDFGAGRAPGTAASLIAALESEHGRERALAVLAVEVKNHTERLRKRGEYDGVLRWSRFGFELSARVGDDHAAGIFMNDGGVAFRNLGETERAIHLLQKSVQYAEILGDWNETAKRWTNLARALHVIGHLENAFDAACRGARAAHRLVDATERLSQFVALGEMFEEIRAWEHAERAFTEGAVEADRLGDVDNLARSLQGRGKALRELGQYEQAARCREGAASWYTAAGDTTGAAIMSFLAAELYARHLSRIADAIPLYQRSADLGRQSGALEVAEKAQARLAELEG
jgi:tetratricopeptide (TPR) repeat protein